MVAETFSSNMRMMIIDNVVGRYCIQQYIALKSHIIFIHDLFTECGSFVNCGSIDKLACNSERSNN